MAQKFKVSVALCTYDGAKFIAPQLESILRQTRPPNEVIVSDDGSQDETVSIVRRIAAQHPSVIRVVENPRRLGIIKNFESTILQASGDIIFLADQDDVWLDRRIERMLQPFAASDEVSLVYCDALLVDDELRPIGKSVFEARSHLHLATRHSARDILRGVDIGVLGSMMAMRSSLKPWVLPIEQVSCGHDHWIVFIAHALAGVRAVNEPLMYYRRHDRNVRNAYSRTLDGQLWREWAQGASNREMETYAQETRRWEATLSRLKEIEAHGVPESSRAALAEFIRETERRVEFSRSRERTKRGRLSGRLLPTLRLLARGDYHFYVHGFRSFAKDLLMP